MKINIDRFRKLLTSYWLNIDYERKQYYNEKKKDEIIRAEQTRLMYTHAYIYEMINEKGIIRRKYFKIVLSNKFSYKEILIPKSSLYCIEDIEGPWNYKRIYVKIDDFSSLVIEQTSLPTELLRI